MKNIILFSLEIALATNCMIRLVLKIMQLQTKINKLEYRQLLDVSLLAIIEKQM